MKSFLFQNELHKELKIEATNLGITLTDYILKIIENRGIKSELSKEALEPAKIIKGKSEMISNGFRPYSKAQSTK